VEIGYLLCLAQETRKKILAEILLGQKGEVEVAVVAGGLSPVNGFSGIKARAQEAIGRNPYGNAVGGIKDGIVSIYY